MDRPVCLSAIGDSRCRWDDKRETSVLAHEQSWLPGVPLALCNCYSLDNNENYFLFLVGWPEGDSTSKKELSSGSKPQVALLTSSERAVSLNYCAKRMGSLLYSLGWPI